MEWLKRWEREYLGFLLGQCLTRFEAAYFGTPQRVCRVCEISDPTDTPHRAGGILNLLLGKDVYAIHVPNDRSTGRLICPKNLRDRVAVEIRDSGDTPVRTIYRGTRSGGREYASRKKSDPKKKKDKPFHTREISLTEQCAHLSRRSKRWSPFLPFICPIQSCSDQPDRKATECQEKSE